MTAFSALDIITDSLVKLGVYAPGEPISAADSATSLAVLNDMIDAWSNEYVFFYSLTTVTATLTSSKVSYTIGPTGADITAPRPARIAYGPNEASNTISAVKTLMNVVSAVEWQAGPSLSVATGTPDTLYYDPQYPLGVLKVSPIPNAGGTFSFNSWVPLQSFPDLSTTYTLSFGGEEALRSNLAVALKSYFADTQLDQITAIRAVETKKALAYSNVNSRAMLRARRMGGVAAGGNG